MARLKIAVVATTLLSLGGLAQASQAPSQMGPDGRQRCGYDEKRALVDQSSPGSDATDCDWNSTNPDRVYAPTFVYSIPVVVHVIEHTNGDGALSPQTVQDQIDVLNEDFRAIPGSLGAPGIDVMIQFHLATVDPDGQPTTGITYSVNDDWHNDEYTVPGYWEVLQWDPLRYLNIYTLNTVGYYGYYWGSPGSPEDGVYLWWRYVGNNDSPTANSDNYGRTATHEVGHYFGLHHTFEGGCAGGNCYSSGDLICDTNPHASETWGCPSSQSSCGSQVPVRNYMNYTDDDCMWEFTEEQARRIRCRIEWYRPDLPDIGTDPEQLFFDDFESGDFATGGWVIKNNKSKVIDKDPFAGTYHARVRKKGWFVKYLDTTGYENIEVRYTRKTKNYDAGESLKVRWSVGAGWTDIETPTDTTYQTVSFFLPAGASNNPNFRLRFKSSANEGKENGDIDDVEIIGTPL